MKKPVRRSRTGGHDLQGVLDNLAHVVGGMLGDLCVVCLRSADGMWVKPKAYTHTNADRQALLRQMYKGLRLP